LRILLVRLRLIGDVVFTTPVIRALRRTYPAAGLDYLVESSAAPVLQTNPHLSALITVEHRRGWPRVKDDLRLAWQLRSARYDLVIDLHGGPRSAWLTWATRAPRRVGYDVPGRSWMYTTAIHRPRTLRGGHSVENQWDLLRAVDPAFSSGPDRDRDRTEMPVDHAAKTSVARRLTAMHVPADATVVVVHVSAGNPFRRWPESSFVDLVGTLASTAPNRWVMITGGPSDRQAAARIVERARDGAGAEAGLRILDAEDWSLAELRALLDRASLFVGGDSGPLHVASTSDVPIVGLYGPTLAERSAPWRPHRFRTASVDVGELPCRPCEQRVCVPGDFRCLTRITASTVAAHAERLLENTR